MGIQLVLRRRYLSVKDVARWSSLRSASERDAALKDAIERRDRAEGRVPPLGLFGGAASLLLGIAAVFDVVPGALLYGVFCFSLSAMIAANYLRLRNTQELRTAILAPRSTASVIPVYWFAIAVLCALSMLTFVTIPQEVLPAALVCCSSLASTYIAWRLTQLPALLSGVNVAAEQHVDEKLRFMRSIVALGFGLAQCLVFGMQVHHMQNALQLVAFWISLPALLGLFVWMRIPDPVNRAVPA